MSQPIEITLKHSQSLLVLFAIYSLGVVLLLGYLSQQEEFQVLSLLLLGVCLVLGIVLTGRRIGLFQDIYQHQARLRIHLWQQSWRLHLAKSSSKAWEECTIVSKGFVCGYGYLEFLYKGNKHIHYSTGKELGQDAWKNYKVWLLWAELGEQQN